MIKIIIQLTFSLLMLVSNAYSQLNQEDFVRADSLVRRLPPSAFPQLPSPISTMLEKGGYTIPQAYGDSLPHNVVVGEFKKCGQRDWAVLASRNRVSSILIFWNGSQKDTTQINRAADVNYVQGMGNLGIVFSRVIGAVRLNIDKDCIEYEPSEKPVTIDHDAIEEVFLGKASEAFYFHNGKWFSCATSD